MCRKQTEFFKRNSVEVPKLLGSTLRLTHNPLPACSIFIHLGSFPQKGMFFFKISNSLIF